MYIYLYSGSLYSSRCCAAYGRGYVPIRIRNVACSSSYTRLSSCGYIANSVGCSAYEVAGVQCHGEYPIDDLLDATHDAIRKNYYLMCQWTV